MADDGFDLDREIEEARRRVEANGGKSAPLSDQSPRLSAPAPDIQAPPFDLDQEIEAARGRVAANGGKAAPMENINPTNMGQLQDQVLSVLSGARRGITSIPGWPGDIQQAYRGVRDYLTPSHDPNSRFPVPEDQPLPEGLPLPTMPTLPTSGDVENKFQEMTGGALTHKPIYPGSEYLEEGASFLPNLIGGEASLPVKLGTRIVAPVVGGEVGAAAGKALGNEEAGRLIGTLGTGLGAAKGEAGLTLRAMEKAGGPKQIAPTREQLHAESGKHYDEFLKNPVAIKKGTTNIFGLKLESVLKQKGFFDATDSAPAVHAAVRHFLRNAEEPMTTGQWKAARTALGNQAFGGTGPERAAGAVAIRELDKWFPTLKQRQLSKGTITQLDDAKELLDRANKNYAAYQRSKQFSNLTRYGKVRASSVNSGMNVGTTVRSRMAALAEAETKHPSLGLLPNELQGVEDIATGSGSQFSRENMMRNYGNMAGGGLGLGASFLGVGPSLYAERPGLAALSGMIPVTGAAAKLRSNRLTLNAADELDKTLRRRSPLAESLGKESVSTSMDADELWKRALILYELQKQQEQGQGQ